MNKKILGSAIVMACAAAGASTSASAALASSAVLSFTGCALDASSYCLPTGGSFFGMDANGKGGITKGERTSISSLNGIAIGTAQAASGSHSGSPNGSEGDNIDNAWEFFTNTGMHQTTSPVTIISDDNAGNVRLNFSGWNVTWNGIASIPMGSGAWGTGFVSGQAQVNCSGTCAVGDTYTLDYRATVPLNDPSGFGGVPYQLHLEGTIGAVPVPAAAWLFGSGLLGLAGVARRRKAA